MWLSQEESGKNLIDIQWNSKILRDFRGIRMLTDFETGHNPIISFFPGYSGMFTVTAINVIPVN